MRFANLEFRITGEFIAVKRDGVLAEISCFHDYGQELALSLLYYLEIGRNHRQK